MDCVFLRHYVKTRTTDFCSSLWIEESLRDFSAPKCNARTVIINQNIQQYLMLMSTKNVSWKCQYPHINK